MKPYLNIQEAIRDFSDRIERLEATIKSEREEMYDQAFIKMVDTAANPEDRETWVNISSIRAVAPGIDAGTSRVWTGYDSYWVTQETPRVFLERLIEAMKASADVG